MLKDLYTKYKVFVNGIIFSVMPFISFILMEFYEHNPFIEIRPVAFLFNILLFELLAWIVYGVHGENEMGGTIYSYSRNDIWNDKPLCDVIQVYSVCAVGHFFN